ncbi:c-Myc-binding protein [Ochlerotatus camptorhynchus]|uniref:c-Myc-binding protein n=1 Tax=Ochlerotatus camptorhynchus TaxID=644619 RepID=UPI0031D6379C
MSSFKPIDGSKEDFRKYLDRKGVLDAITKVLIKCNSDRPENAIEYLLDNLGERLKDKDTIARLENELNDARNEIETLKREMNALKVNVTTNTETGNAVSPSDDSLSGNAVDSTGLQDGSNEDSTEATNPSSKVNADKETTNNVDSGETGAVAKTPENAESDPKELVAQ